MLVFRYLYTIMSAFIPIFLSIIGFEVTHTICHFYQKKNCTHITPKLIAICIIGTILTLCIVIFSLFLVIKSGLIKDNVLSILATTLVRYIFYKKVIIPSFIVLFAIHNQEHHLWIVKQNKI